MIGYTPAQVDEMDLWEFAMCVRGYRAANTVEPAPEPPSAEKFHEMVVRHERLTGGAVGHGRH